MNKEERIAKAKEMVVKILQLLESESLTVQDARRVLQGAMDNLQTVSLVSVPEVIEIEGVKLPEFANHPPAPPHS